MTHPARIAEFSPSEYLDWEATQVAKHEYFGGEVFAMVGATRRHVTVAMNVSSQLMAHLKGGDFRVYMSHMKLRIEAANAFFYPDILVTCSPKDHAADLFLTNPCLVVEVLSPSTEAYDRGEKFAAYRLLDSLQEYALIDPETRRIEVYRKDTAGRWYLSEPDSEGYLELASVGLRCAIGGFFENA